MSYLPIFSHIYVENKALEYPITTHILERFTKATKIEIQNYKEVFNRPRQLWEHQKNSLKLILAVREDAFLYPGSAFVPSYNHTRFFYTTPVLNCLYGCEYCYLQGMFPSANLVAFVNQGDFISAATSQLQPPLPAYLCISYDTDLLALEDIFGYCAQYISYARLNPHVTIEIRTKSANIEALSDLSPPPNVILAWTLSPDNVVAQYEHRTPRLAARLNSIAKASERGWKIRICFDPILRISDWHEHYADLVKATFSQISAGALTDVSFGVFRIPSGYLRTMQESNPGSKLAHYPYTIEKNRASYHTAEQTEMLEYMNKLLADYLPQEKICPVPWQL